MEAITIRLEASTLESLDGEASEYDRTRSEHVREVVRTRNEYDRIQAEYEARIEDLETENERLKNEKRLILEQREENTELVEYASHERAYREAGIGTRMKWWLFGRDRSENHP
jgi:septal ring factor EnvC (AmiA/AmiB activator)